MRFCADIHGPQMMSDFADPPFLEHHHEIDFFWGLSEMFCQDVKDGLP